MAAKVSYVFIKHAPESGEGKLPPQAATILKELENFGKTEDGSANLTVNRDELVAALTTGETNKLNARQPVERVIAFYQKRFVDEGLISLVKHVAEPKPAKEKVAKAPKAGKTKVPLTAEEAAAADPENVAESLMA